jgi:hypothetical protein
MVLQQTLKKLRLFILEIQANVYPNPDERPGEKQPPEIPPNNPSPDFPDPDNAPVKEPPLSSPLRSAYFFSIIQNLDKKHAPLSMFNI